ncbi:hypothetical protein GGG17_11760 [Arsenicicoccus sp. MKL-02]|uniref:TonB-dependent receptor n=1 Tax=Arsenicicoccus cauae TaxID=2663847 RepID=A0A6I3IRR6_9MICO|nr:hypothetical protein [Arsenicicoccus cauae]MTB72630.1 hypothetical protein [Arsenicicoccus cauae]
MGFSALGRSRLVATPAVAAMMLVAAPAAAQASGATPGHRAVDRQVTVTTQVPETALFGGGTTRRFTGSVSSLDDIRRVVS